MPNRIEILGSPIDNLTMEETLDVISDAVRQGKHLHHTVVNAGKLVLMDEDSELRESVVNADVINADGQAVVWASRLFGKPLKERVAGIDLMERIVERAYRDGHKLFFFGAKEEVVSRLVSHYAQKYDPGIIGGYRNGYFKKEEERKIAEDIANSGANILFVAISSPTKENFLYQNKDVLFKVNFVMGVGGSFDVVAGKIKRAPRWMQRAGLEWLYRVYQEPKRMFKRYLVGNTKFLLLVLRYSLRKRS